MSYIKSIPKYLTKFDNTHEIKQYYFKNSNNFIAACETNTHFYIQMKSNEDVGIGLSSPANIGFLQHQFDAHRTVYLECFVNFSNRGMIKKGLNIKRLYPEEAKLKFCKMTGLQPAINKFSNCVFLGENGTKKFKIFNSFKISGFFRITDLNLFNQSLENGIGSYKSYGYGLIIIKEIL